MVRVSSNIDAFIITVRRVCPMEYGNTNCYSIHQHPKGIIDCEIQWEHHAKCLTNS